MVSSTTPRLDARCRRFWKWCRSFLPGFPAPAEAAVPVSAGATPPGHRSVKKSRHRCLFFPFIQKWFVSGLSPSPAAASPPFFPLPPAALNRGAKALCRLQTAWSDASRVRSPCSSCFTISSSLFKDLQFFYGHGILPRICVSPQRLSTLHVMALWTNEPSTRPPGTTIERSSRSGGGRSWVML